MYTTVSALIRGVSKCPFADGPRMDIGGQRDGSLHTGRREWSRGCRQAGTQPGLEQRT